MTKDIKTLKQVSVAEYLEYRNEHLWWIKSPGRRVKVGDRFGSKRKDGRIGGQIFGKYYLEHRLIWLLKTGEWPTEVLDHKDGLNNDPSNLRQATNQQNQFNRGPRKNKSSIYKGVCKHRGRWYVQYRLNGKNHFPNWGAIWGWDTNSITTIDDSNATVYNQVSISFKK